MLDLVPSNTAAHIKYGPTTSRGTLHTSDLSSGSGPFHFNRGKKIVRRVNKEVGTNWEELRVSIVLIVAIRLNFITYPGVLPPRIEIVSHYQSSVCLQVCTDCMHWLQGTCRPAVWWGPEWRTWDWGGGDSSRPPFIQLQDACLYDDCLLGTDWPDMMICPGPGTGDCPEYSLILHKLYKYTVNNKHHEYLSPTAGLGNLVQWWQLGRLLTNFLIESGMRQENGLGQRTFLHL